MSHNELPKYLAPEKLCRQSPAGGTEFSGEIKLSHLKGVMNELSIKKDSIVAVSLNFSMDLDSLCCVKGNISTTLELICQRCLQPMDYHLNAEFEVSPVASDQQAERLPGQYEPLWAPTGEINVAEWIAEEIHLALPLAPCHEPICVSFDTGESKLIS